MFEKFLISKYPQYIFNENYTCYIKIITKLHIHRGISLAYVNAAKM
jgi:hypothetical protein